MKASSTDPDLDKLLKNLVDVAGADESIIEEAAMSPTVWWGVHRRIRSEHPVSAAGRVDFRKWLLIASPVAAAAMLLIIFASLPHRDEMPVEQAATFASNIYAITETPVSGDSEQGLGEAAPVRIRTKVSASPRPRPRKQRFSRDSTPKRVLTRPKEEIRTEFIALSYARDPESGQIVRLKVPRSMMVAVGLVASVEKPAALVDAEVIVGDDGLTRAIRFIR